MLAILKNSLKKMFNTRQIVVILANKIPVKTVVGTQSFSSIDKPVKVITIVHIELNSSVSAQLPSVRSTKIYTAIVLSSSVNAPGRAFLNRL